MGKHKELALHQVVACSAGKDWWALKFSFKEVAFLVIFFADPPIPQAFFCAFESVFYTPSPLIPLFFWEKFYSPKAFLTPIGKYFTFVYGSALALISYPA